MLQRFYEQCLQLPYPWHVSCCMVFPSKFFHKVDVWHDVRLGQGKCYAASSIAALLDIFEGSSVEAKLACVTTEFFACASSVCLVLMGLYFVFGFCL